MSLLWSAGPDSTSLLISTNQMDFQSAMETFAEAWVAANAGKLNFHPPVVPFPNNPSSSGSSGVSRRDESEIESTNQIPVSFKIWNKIRACRIPIP